MKKAITLILLASLLTASFASCGTVENVGVDSEISVSDSSSGDELEDITDETSVTDIAEITEENTDGSEVPSEDATEENSGQNDTTEAQKTEAPTAAPTEAPKTEAPTQAPTQAPQQTASFTADDMYFLYGGAQATVLIDASGLVDALGTPSDIAEAPGCLSNGLDEKVYYYPGLTIYTYVDGGRPIIYDIEITSASYATPKGLKVGMSESEIEKIYGKDYVKSGNAYCFYDTVSTYMYISTSGGIVTSIDYCADI